MNKEQIINDNAKLIYKIASKFYGIDKEDLYQAGRMGLLKAMQKYNQEYDAKFTTFAYKYIFGEIYVLANRRNIKINRDILKIARLIEKTRYEYAQKYYHIPTNEEIAAILNLSVDTINFACAANIQILSMDNDDETTRNMYETIAKPESVSQDDKILLYDTLEMLPEEERNVIIRRYFNDETQEMIASKLNTSQVKVSRLEKKGVTRMRELMKTF